MALISCLCGMLTSLLFICSPRLTRGSTDSTSLLFVLVVFCLRDCSLRRLCQCVLSTTTRCCRCCQVSLIHDLLFLPISTIESGVS